MFNSAGGNVHDGLALFTFLRQLRAEGHHLTTMGIGRVASMGSVLLQAGDVRVLGANAFLEILAERSTMTVTAISRRWTPRDWWLDAADAVTLGFRRRGPLMAGHSIGAAMRQQASLAFRDGIDEDHVHPR